MKSYAKLFLTLLAFATFLAWLPTASQATLMAPKSVAWQDGGALYSKSCASCHGADGKAQTAKGKLLNATNFTNPKWQNGTSDAKGIKTITNGRGAMPGYKKTLSGDEIKAVMSYLRGFK